MIKTERLTINGKEYTRTWSDEGMMVERDGALYDEAYDPADSARAYTETDVPCEYSVAEAEDYEAALARLGVE